MIFEHSALVGSPAPDRGLVAAIEVAIDELGYARSEIASRSWNPWPCAGRNAELDVTYLMPDDDGAWACLGITPPMARAIAARLASRLQIPIQMFTATATYKVDEDDPSLKGTVEDRLVRPDGRSAVGTFGRELEASVFGDWRSLCDAKSAFLIGSLMDSAIDEWVPAPFARQTATWSPPPSLGIRRLDEIALQIRLAPRAELSTIDGRPCIRVATADGGKTTSFLTPDELARLEAAVGHLFTR